MASLANFLIGTCIDEINAILLKLVARIYLIISSSPVSSLNRNYCICEDFDVLLTHNCWSFWQNAVIQLLLQSSGLEWFDGIADKALSEFR